jgi:hypothetical protein
MDSEYGQQLDYEYSQEFQIQSQISKSYNTRRDVSKEVDHFFEVIGPLYKISSSSSLNNTNKNDGFYNSSVTTPKGWQPPNPPLTDDRIQKMSDPNNHEIGLKKWMIDRISYEIPAFKDILKTSKDEFETVDNDSSRKAFCQ